MVQIGINILSLIGVGFVLRSAIKLEHRLTKIEVKLEVLERECPYCKEGHLCRSQD